MKKFNLLFFATMLLAVCSAFGDTTKEFGAVGKDGDFADKTEGEGTAGEKKPEKFKKNLVQWKLNLKYAENAKRMLKYYEKKKDAKQVKLYKMKIQGFQMKAKGFQAGNKNMVTNAEYLIQGKPIPAPPKPKKEGGGGAAAPAAPAEGEAQEEGM